MTFFINSKRDSSKIQHKVIRKWQKVKRVRSKFNGLPNCTIYLTVFNNLKKKLFSNEQKCNINKKPNF